MRAQIPQISFFWMWTEIFKYSIRYVIPVRNSKTSWLTAELYVGRRNYKWELENTVVSAKILAHVTSPGWECAATQGCICENCFSVLSVLTCPHHSPPSHLHSVCVCVCPAARAAAGQLKLDTIAVYHTQTSNLDSTWGTNCVIFCTCYPFTPGMPRSFLPLPWSPGIMSAGTVERSFMVLTLQVTTCCRTRASFI